MSKHFPYLLSPVKVRGHVLKNRMVSTTSLPHFLMGPEEYPPKHIINLMADRAKMGAALVTMSHVYAPFGAKGMKFGGDTLHFAELNMYDPQCQNYFFQMADAIHYYDSKALLNINRPHVTEWSVVDDPRRGAKAYTPEIIEKFIDAYVQQAIVAKDLGFDGVSVHFAYRSTFAGALFSPLTNTRTDQFGGSLENRSWAVREIFRRIKAELGETFITEGLMSAFDLPGGYTFEDTKKFAKMAEGLIDILQVRMDDGDPSHPMGFHEPTPTLPYAAQLKELNLDMLIEPVGGYFDPTLCDSIIRDGKADLIGMARNWISNDHYGQMVEEGRADDITPCIRCNKCHVIVAKKPYLSACSVNPEHGMETYMENYVAPVGAKKKVAVVGGGPAGMEAAIVSAKRGHEVTLFEKSERLGGQLISAAVPDFKWPLRDFTDYLIHQTHKNGVAVRLNTEATKQALESEGFDVVIAALGGVPRRPAVAGIEKAITAVDALLNTDSVAENVVIIGAGEIGVETGIHLGQLGRRVTVLGRNKKIAPNCVPIHYRETFQRTWESVETLSILTEAKVLEVRDGEILFEHQGEKKTIPADTVIVASGTDGLVDEALTFYSDKYVFRMVGDCTGGESSVMRAMRTAFGAASQI